MEKLTVKYLLISAVSLLIMISACSNAGSEGEVINLKISGMTCNHCVEHVTKALQSVEGVDTAKVNLETDSAIVQFSGERPSNEALVEAVKKAGYGAEVVE
jgi:Cu+-exporting ATPase